MLALLLVGCAHAQAARTAPEVSIASVDRVELRGRDAHIDLTLAVRNPNPIDLPLREITAHARFNGADVLDGRSTAPVNLPAQGSADVPLRLDIDSAALLALLATLPPDGKVAYALDGQAEIGSTLLRVPFHRDGTIRLSAQR